jgi:WD40 repeat protein
LVVLRDDTLAVGTQHGSISIWNSKTQTHIRNLYGHTAEITRVLVLSDGSLASASHDKTIKIWNPQTGELLRSLESHTRSILHIVQLSNRLLASGSIDGTIKIWNSNTGELLKTIGIGEYFSSLALLGDGNLACVSNFKLIILNPETEQIVRPIENNSFWGLALLSDGSLAIDQRDSNITIWDVNNWKLLRTLKGHTGSIFALKLLSDGSLASGSNDGEMKIWNPINGQLLKKIQTDGCFKSFSIGQLSNGDLVSASGNLKFWS